MNKFDRYFTDELDDEFPLKDLVIDVLYVSINSSNWFLVFALKLLIFSFVFRFPF